MEIEINEKERLKRKIRDLKERLENIGEEGEDEMKEKGEEYAQMLRERGREAYKKAKYAREQVDQYVHKHPWVLLGVGALIGLTIGAAASMKSCKKYCR